jgi:hypothetical protein
MGAIAPGVITGPLKVLVKARLAFGPLACFRAGYFHITFGDKDVKVITELGKLYKAFKQSAPGLKTIRQITHFAFPP